MLLLLEPVENDLAGIPSLGRTQVGGGTPATAVPNSIRQLGLIAMAVRVEIRTVLPSPPPLSQSGRGALKPKGAMPCHPN